MTDCFYVLRSPLLTFMFHLIFYPFQALHRMQRLSHIRKGRTLPFPHGSLCYRHLTSQTPLNFPVQLWRWTILNAIQLLLCLPRLRDSCYFSTSCTWSTFKRNSQSQHSFSMALRTLPITCNSMGLSSNKHNLTARDRCQMNLSHLLPESKGCDTEIPFLVAVQL